MNNASKSIANALVYHALACLTLGLAILQAAGANTPCPKGDLNGDCVVDIDDLVTIAEYWLDPDCSNPACGDIDIDRQVNMSDLAVIAGRWHDAASPLAVTEFMASNTTILSDEDGDFSDWIEICNISGKPVDLLGWYLTDDKNAPKKWPFPSVQLDSGEYLLIFASEKNRSDPAGQLHTSFALNRQGDYLALTNPDKGISHEYPYPFPSQLSDVSYGLVENSISSRLIKEGDPTKHHVPADGQLNSSWLLDTFDDSAWTSGFTPVGYEQGGPQRETVQLVGYWTFDDNVLDSSGNSNHASLAGPAFSDDIPPTLTSGKSLVFDGLSDYLQVPDSQSMDLATGIGQPCTVAFWFKTFEDQSKVVMEKGPRRHFVTRMEAFADAGKISYRMQEDIENQVTSVEPVNDGQWHHFLAAFDGATLRLYIDGVLNSEAQDTGHPDNDDPLVVGSRFGAAPWEGMMDDLAIWNCVLDEGQIALLSDGSVSPMNVNGVASPVDERLAGYWDFNGTVDDVSEHGHDASNSGAVFSTEVPPAIGQGMSLRFDGLNDYVLIPDAPGLRIASQFTLSLWIKSNDINQMYKYLLSRHGVGYQQAVIYEYADNQVEFFGPNAAGDDPRPGSQMPIPDTDWHHIAYTYDGAAWSGYVDGIGIFSVQRSFVLNTGEYPWYVGSAKPTVGFFDGWIDDVSIWTQALSQNEVANLAAGVSPRAVLGYEGLIKTDLEIAMYSKNSSVYIRHTFHVDDTAELEDLSLRVKYDDGFIAYLNGIEVARRNAPQPTMWNSAATASNPDEQAVLFEDIDISPFMTLLQPDTNVLAVHALNEAADDDDFLWSCELTAQQPWQSSQTYRYFSVPTPGSANGQDARDIGPVIDQVAHTPNVPSTGENIVVTVSITESFFPLDNARLIYRVMYGPQVSVPMRDDGIAPDETAGDNIFSASIPAAAYAPGQMVRWYIKAVDIQQNQSRWPIFNDQIGSPEYLGTVVYDPSVSSNIPVFHWFLEPGTEQAARTRSGTRCSLFYDGRFYDNIFVRLRGATAAGLAKNPYKFEFNKGYYFHYSDDFPEIDEFDLNTTYRDKAYIRPILGYELYRDAGVPYSNVFCVHVRRNNDFFSVAIFTEHPDKTFLERNGLDPDGTIYKANLNGFTPDAQGGYLDVYSGFEKKNPKDNDNSDIVAFVNGLAQTGPVQTNFVFDNVDIPSVINYMAASVIIQDADRLVTNFFAYRDTYGTKEWTMLPWDLDLSLGQAINSSDQIFADDDYPNGPSHPFYGAQNNSDWRNPYLWNKMIDIFCNTPVLREMFLRRLRTLMDSFLMPTGTPAEQLYFENRIDQLYTAMANDVLLDKAKWSSWGQSQTFQQALDRIKNDYLAPRRTHLFVNHRADDIQQSDPTILVSEDAAKTVIVPTGTVNESWKSNINFNDSSWISGTGGIGYEAGSGSYASYFDIDTKSLMYNTSGTCLIRIPFTVEGNPTSFEKLSLRVRYDDGFIAWLNGTLVEQKNAPSDPKWDSQATEGHSDNSAVVFTDHNISSYINTLNQGENLLAIHGLNFPISSSDFLISVELIEGDFETSNPAAVGIPAVQIDSPAIDFGAIDFNPDSANQDQEYIELVNNNNTAVDISGWHLTGGIDFTFKTGTIIPSGKSLYLSPDVTAFRTRANGPSSGQGLFIQGNYNGHLSSWGETITLADSNYGTVATVTYTGNPSSQQEYLRISEIMYHPHSGGPYNEEEYEYIELKNIGSQPLLLDGVKFTEGVIYQFPSGGGVYLQPDRHIVIVKNRQAFESRYDTSNMTLASGTYEGSLSNSGECINIEDETNSTILEFSYDDDWFGITDGPGFSLTIRDVDNPDLDSWDSKSGWRPSAEIDGSPGEDDPDMILGPGSIVISEVMTHTDDLVYGDWIEIWNRTGSPVYIGGWFLSDNELNLRKYEIAAGDPHATILPDSYVVFDSVNDFRNSGDPGSNVQFGLSEHGEDVYLTSGAGGVLTGEYSTEQENFGAAENGVTLGMYIKSDASDDFVRLLTVTKGYANNNDPIIGPVVISEIMYNPQDPDSEAEFIEVTNLTSSTVFLYDTANPANTWQIKGVSYVFPPGVTLSANETILITRGNPTTFRSTYGIPGSIDIYGPYPGALDNGGEKVTLIKPGTPDPITFEVPEIRIDRVNYDDSWYPTTDGDGKSLTRKVLAEYGNDLANWQADDPSPGQ